MLCFFLLLVFRLLSLVPGFSFLSFPCSIGLLAWDMAEGIYADDCVHSLFTVIFAIFLFLFLFFSKAV
jgi:hypothetical protein